MQFQNTISYAKQLDEADELKSFRAKFYIPLINGKECIYFTGNSLGLQPKTTQHYVLDELEDWANFGVEGHVHGRKPWVSYHEMFPALLSKIVGGHEDEIVVMNQLTINLHLLMASFYRPTKQRYKIICEAKAFPSDQYAMQSQANLFGFNPNEVIVQVAPREGEFNIRTEDIIATIEQHADSTALVLFSGVNYFNGQVFDMKAITTAAHKAGAYCGFDLAHAVGNIQLQLHDWDVDFACWCSYKYLNSGPGGVAGAFIHSKHIANFSLPRLAGWWGHDKSIRFEMDQQFKPMPTAEGWQLSNAPILSMAAHKAALDIFKEAGSNNIFEKGQQLSNYLLYIIDEINNSFSEIIVDVITPRNNKGCQISMIMLKNGKQIFEQLKQQGIIADWREPNVIRVAPVPLYNSFTDVFQFGKILKEIIAGIQ